ncbi:OLC1v1015377C1 [Oldenlandia corymbosa var. corymbosa]|uniref:OLC1v1015377C1 n=1 Tax=Oldenlandia corymbosa var. corymbosa TaxID=529605 RepID=A0AAV1E3X1_OLDCO|nr:OLC1v1015377C1 [Oldenlandia corymbosa var. corymbosa]
METKSLSFLLIVVLWLCNTFLICSSSTAKQQQQQQPDPVLDIDGKPLRTSGKYYILPVIRGRGGGLTLSSSDNLTCPLFVAQDPFEVNFGLPVIFSPAKPTKGGAVRVSSDQNIRFDAATICVQSTVWKLSYDDGLKQYFVVSGGVQGNPGPKTLDNWFKIEKFNREDGSDKKKSRREDYKLVFCPTVCNYCKVICRDVGIFIQNGTRRLALSDVPFMVQFKKA